MHPIQAAMLAMREIAESYWAPLGVDCYRDGEKDNELASGALRKPGRGDGGDGKKGSRRLRAVAHGGRAAGRAGAEELDGVLGRS